mgnify:CR=1 FL=1
MALSPDKSVRGHFHGASACLSALFAAGRYDELIERGCHTQGRTVDEARRRIVEAMELFVDGGRTAKIVDGVKLPPGAAQAVRSYVISGGMVALRQSMIAA